MAKQKDGRETWRRLLEWDKGQSPSERLAAQFLIYEKYDSVDPSHPLGGRDGGKDIICRKGNKKYIVSVYFPRGQKSFSEIQKKLKIDIERIKKNKTDGIIFITNQELTLAEREKLKELTTKFVHIMHLEILSMILNAPNNYGLRLEFLDIEMTKEEQLSVIASKDSQIISLQNEIKQFSNELNIINSKEKEVNSITVTPQYFYYKRFEYKPYHKCSICSFGFIIYKPEVDYSYAVASIGNNVKLVTCPKCGNVDELNITIW